MLTIKDFLKLGAIALVLIFTFWAASHFMPSPAGAHPGGLSSKDGCHRDRKAGERHWHKKGSAEVGGLCVNGKKLPAPLTRDQLERKVEDLGQELRSVNTARAREANRRSIEIRDLRSTLRTQAAAISEAQAAAAKVSEAADRRVRLMERKLKAIITGQPVCLKERAALGLKIKQGTWGARGWREDARGLLNCLATGE